VYPLSEHRTLPKSIPHPVWWQDGNPKYSRSLINRNKIEILDAAGQQAMRKSCKLAREILDIAAAAAKPGVTTDEIDKIVHDACIERNVRKSVEEIRQNFNLFLVISFASELQSLPKVVLHFAERSHLPWHS
jgi:L-serine deaminase